MFRDFCYWAKLALYKVGIEIGDADILSAMYERAKEEQQFIVDEEMKELLVQDKEKFTTLPHFADEETVRQKTKRENREQLKKAFQPAVQAFKKVTNALCVAYQPTTPGIPLNPKIKKTFIKEYQKHHVVHSLRKPLRHR